MKIVLLLIFYISVGIESRCQFNKYKVPCNDSIKELNIKTKLLEYDDPRALIKLNFIDSLNRKFVVLASSSNVYKIFRDSFPSMDSYLFNMNELLLDDSTCFFATKKNKLLHVLRVNENEYNLIKGMDLDNFIDNFFTKSGFLKFEYWQNFLEIGLYLNEHCILFHTDGMKFTIDNFQQLRKKVSLL